MTRSIHLKTRIRVSSAIVLCNSDVLGHCTADFESHGVVHLLFDATAIGKDENDIDAHKDADNQDEDFSADRVWAHNLRILKSNVLLIVKVDANLRLFLQVRANVFNDIFGRDITSERHSIDGY